jgi:Na+-driven multidrug efflux pump
MFDMRAASTFVGSTLGSRWENRPMLTTHQSLFIVLGTMLMILASSLFVERYFPSHAKSHPPIAFTPSDTNTCNDCS